MLVTAPAAEVRHVVPPEVSTAIDELSLRAIDTRAVQATSPGTLGRLQAVRDYVVKNWPEKGTSESQIAGWFDDWVARMRRQTLAREPEPILV